MTKSNRAREWRRTLRAMAARDSEQRFRLRGASKGAPAFGVVGAFTIAVVAWAGLFWLAQLAFAICRD